MNEEIKKSAKKIISNMGMEWENTETSARMVAEYCAAYQVKEMYTHEEVNQYILDVMSGLLVLTIKEWKESKKWKRHYKNAKR